VRGAGHAAIAEGGTLRGIPKSARWHAASSDACWLRQLAVAPMASSEANEPGVEDDDSLDLQEIELEQQKLALQRQELQLRERKLAVLRKRKGGGA
jgi:hypothetical protein